MRIDRPALADAIATPDAMYENPRKLCFDVECVVPNCTRLQIHWLDPSCPPDYRVCSPRSSVSVTVVVFAMTSLDSMIW
jgi:hypothetical protein